jgi:hypothetical protein
MKLSLRVWIFHEGHRSNGGFVQHRNILQIKIQILIIKNPNRLNDDSNAAQNDKFFFEPAEHVVTSTDTVTKVVTTTRTSWNAIEFEQKFFKTKILDAGFR